MEFNNLESIINCLKAWDNIRNNAPAVVEYLGLGNCFTFKRNMREASNLHAYPGICTADKTLYMFLIDAEADRNSSQTDLFNAITVCKVKRSLGSSDEIPQAEALKRIDNWKKEYPDWATQQINLRAQTQGIFRAFNVPSTHIQQNIEYSSFFGLKEQSDTSARYSADLITVDRTKASIAYYDTVRPVPPFDVAPQSSFYLLNLL